MATKKRKYNTTGIGQPPDDKPVLYRIETEAGKPNYIGTAKRDRVRERISEHLGEIPGATVRIEQIDSIAGAREKESRAIKHNQPKYNKQDK